MHRHSLMADEEELYVVAWIRTASFKTKKVLYVYKL